MENGILGAADVRRGGGLWGALLVAAFWLVPLPAAEPATGVDEFRVKAAFLYNFCKFVRWPDAGAEQDREPFVVAVVGNPPMATVLTRELTGKRIGGRAVLVRPFTRLRDVRDARVAYVSLNELKDQRLSQRERLERESVLTVGDGRPFIENGGVLALEIREERLVFEVNLGAARRARLELSANLLGLAVAVLDR